MRELSVENRFHAAIGKAVQEARRKRRLTQSALASAVGLTRASISNIERGAQSPLLVTFVLLARKLDVTPESMLPRDVHLGATPRTEVAQDFQDVINKGKRDSKPGGLTWQ